MLRNLFGGSAARLDNRVAARAHRRCGSDRLFRWAKKEQRRTHAGFGRKEEQGLRCSSRAKMLMMSEEGCGG